MFVTAAISSCNQPLAFLLCEGVMAACLYLYLNLWVFKDNSAHSQNAFFGAVVNQQSTQADQVVLGNGIAVFVVVQPQWDLPL